MPVGEDELVLANVGGHVVAAGDLCLRCSASLSGAALRDATLTCLHCGWQYDLDRGDVVGLPALRFERHDVRVENGRMFVATGVIDDPSPVS